ncbi:MAG: PorT family protein [Parabacteroides sp.]|nr:PorT family protein [Parabacteroides sp.]
MKKQLIISILGLLLLTSHSLFAQKDRNAGIINSYLIGLEYEVKAGFSIGGTSPLPLPKEIRSIDSYNPTLQIAIEGNVTKWLNTARTWGIMLALRLETKGMKTDARVKNYSMEIIGDGGERMKGFWTGQVKTKVNNSYLTVPVLAAWRVSPRWKLNAGPYVSYRMEGDFTGDVYDGYLRELDPTGNKVVFEDGKSAPYDFSKDLRRFAWGLQLGGEWKAFKHLNVYADLTWGMNDIFKKDFNTITFAMYPIYLNMGFGYAF